MTLQSIGFKFFAKIMKGSCVFCCLSCISFNLPSHLNIIYIFGIVCVFWFCSIAFYLVSIILFENFVIYFHLKSIFDMLEYFANFFSANFFKEIAKLFSKSARKSANNSSLFSVHCLAFFVVLPYFFLRQ